MPAPRYFETMREEPEEEPEEISKKQLTFGSFDPNVLSKKASHKVVMPRERVTELPVGPLARLSRSMREDLGVSNLPHGFFNELPADVVQCIVVRMTVDPMTLVHLCAWRVEDFGISLRWVNDWMVQNRRPGYDEIIVDAVHWRQHLPDVIECFVNSPDAHAAFLNEFGLSARTHPHIRLSSKWDAPFSE